jgi:hypothetical protein
MLTLAMRHTGQRTKSEAGRAEQRAEGRDRCTCTEGRDERDRRERYTRWKRGEGVYQWRGVKYRDGTGKDREQTGVVV